MTNDDVYIYIKTLVMTNGLYYILWTDEDDENGLEVLVQPKRSFREEPPSTVTWKPAERRRICGIRLG